MPAAPSLNDAASLVSVAKDPEKTIALARAELGRLVGSEGFLAVEKLPDGVAFLNLVLDNRAVLGDLLLSGPWHDAPLQTLPALHHIWKGDPKCFDNRHERTTAVATALSFSRKGWPPEKAFDRYKFFRDSRLQGRLHPSFDTLETWEKRYVTAASGNGGYAETGGWDDASLYWLRDNVKLPMAGYIGACWQAPYRLENVFGDSIHGSRYYAPFDTVTHAQRVRDVGGVCGSLSHYGANAARANGIPAITMGEPGHCAYAVRQGRGNWTAAYSLSWERGPHFALWEASWNLLVLSEIALDDKEAHDRCQVHLWEARQLREKTPALADDAYQLALVAQPLNYMAWKETAEAFRDKLKPDAATWTRFHDGALKSLAAHPEAAFKVVNVLYAAMPKDLSEADRAKAYLHYHEAVAPNAGPLAWKFDSALDAQAKLIGKDTAKLLAFFERVLALQSKSAAWFAPTISWGQDEFGKDPKTSAAYFAALARVFANSSAGGSSDGLRNALRAALLAAATADNTDAFQALGKTTKPFVGETKTKVEAFSGDLLSSGGLLKLSSTCGHDAPESHWAVIEGLDKGRCHTDSEVRPNVTARLGRLGEVSGIVVVNNPGQNIVREFPMVVSVSENGKDWTQVARIAEPVGVVRVGLDAAQGKRVQYVRVGRDDDRKEFFHLQNLLVYGRKLQ